MRITAILCSLASATSHGIFWNPMSRAQLAQNSGWEADSTSIISEPMRDVASGRPYPGGRPWAEPGKSVQPTSLELAISYRPGCPPGQPVQRNASRYR